MYAFCMHQAARQRVGPGHHLVRAAHGPPSSLLRTPCMCQKNRDFGFCFVQFREYFQNNFSETKNSRKQELTLWHLVNMLVPENA